MLSATAKPQVLTIDDLEQHATLHLPKMVRDYYNGGSMDAYTLASNVEAYRQWYVMPRVLRDVSRIDTAAVAFDQKISFPCCVAPAAMQRMAHPDGEEATARAAGSKGVVMGLSSFATTSLEVVKAECDKATSSGISECVLQMYLFENREVSENLIRRAESTIPFQPNLSGRSVLTSFSRGWLQSYSPHSGHAIFWSAPVRDAQWFQSTSTFEDG